MMRKGGYFYVCGSSRNVPEDIYAAMKRVIAKEGQMSEEAAEAALETLKREGRYIVEAWA
jgi:sulfite reductase (NADPH) flavoprotein alpha-component